jgi:hypothetical protein
MTALWFLAGFLLGGVIGIMVMCLCFIAKQADREIERSAHANTKEDL